MANPEEHRKLFHDFLAKYGNRRIAIATHSRADADSISCAFTLSKILPDSVICITDEMQEGAAMLAERLGIKTGNLQGLNKDDFEGLLVVDTSTYALLPEAKGWKVLCIIDHHRGEGRDMKAEFEIINTDAPSAAEIIAYLVDDIGKEAAFGLCVGIISDGARFKSARMETFGTLARLMKAADASYPELLSYAEPEPKEEAKVAVLKAMKRVNYVYAAGYMIATSEVGSNESDAASLIAEIADVAFVANWQDRERESRVSARARKNVKVPLNKVMAEVGEALGGAGGGHPKAAGASTKEHTEETLKKCVEVFIRMAEQ